MKTRAYNEDRRLLCILPKPFEGSSNARALTYEDPTPGWLLAQVAHTQMGAPMVVCLANGMRRMFQFQQNYGNPP